MGRTRSKKLTIPGRKLRDMRDSMGLTRDQVAKGIDATYNEDNVKHWELTVMPDDILRKFFDFLRLKIEERRKLVMEADALEKEIRSLNLSA